MKKVSLLHSSWAALSRAAIATVITAGIATGYEAYTNHTVDQNNVSTKVDWHTVEKDAGVAGLSALFAAGLTATAIRRRHNAQAEGQRVVAEVSGPS